jgi:TRAP-type transport system periplasmic protein
MKTRLLKTGILIALLAGVTTAGTASSFAAEDFSNSPNVTLRLTSASPPGMEDSLAMIEAAEMLKKETDGTVVIEPFFSSSLFDEIAGMSAATTGLIDMAVACTCNMTKQTSAMLFSDVPYLWQEMDNGREVWNGEIGGEIREELTETLNVVPLAFTPSGGGFRILWNNQREVKVPADVEGLKLRTTATPLEQEFWKSIGGIPTPVDVKEIYSALQHGLVDGQHLQPVWLTLLKHDEVTKYGTEIEALAVYRILVINQNSLAKLDDKQKAALDRAMEFYEDKAYEFNRSLRDQEMQKIKDRGISVYNPSEEEMAQWREAGAKFQESETVTNLVPSELIERARDAQE